MSDCHGVWGTICGHDFRPRYSIEGHEHPDILSWSSFATTYTVSKSDNPELLKTLNPPYKKTYECDVCARCGKVVRRTDM